MVLVVSGGGNEHSNTPSTNCNDFRSMPADNPISFKLPVETYLDVLTWSILKCEAQPAQSAQYLEVTQAHDKWISQLVAEGQSH